jgi:hypothetical protein
MVDTQDRGHLKLTRKADLNLNRLTSKSVISVQASQITFNDQDFLPANHENDPFAVSQSVVLGSSSPSAFYGTLPCRQSFIKLLADNNAQQRPSYVRRSDLSRSSVSLRSDLLSATFKTKQKPSEELLSMLHRANSIILSSKKSHEPCDVSDDEGIPEEGSATHVKQYAMPQFQTPQQKYSTGRLNLQQPSVVELEEYEQVKNSLKASIRNFGAQLPTVFESQEGDE